MYYLVHREYGILNVLGILTYRQGCEKYEEEIKGG